MIFLSNNMKLALCCLTVRGFTRFHTRVVGRWNSNGSLTILGHTSEMLETSPGIFVLYLPSSSSRILECDRHIHIHTHTCNTHIYMRLLLAPMLQVTNLLFFLGGV